jgi:zinc protease
LFLNLRQDNRIRRGAYSRTVDLLGTAWFQAHADVRSDVTEPALSEFEAEFARYQNEPLPPAEVSDAAEYLSGVFPLELETNAALASRLCTLTDLGFGVDFLQGYRDRVRQVDVAAAQAAGRSFIARPGLALVLVGEEGVVVPAKAHASRVFVYDLTGALVREEPGQLPSTCAP